MCNLPSIIGDVNILLHDTTGQEKFRSITSQYVKKPAIILYVFGHESNNYFIRRRVATVRARL
jgi:GTPase SAR1 family protein